MTPKELIDAFEVLADAPDGIARLRELVLALAVRGTLVSQNPAEGSADDLISTFGVNKDELIENGTIAVPRHPEGEPVGTPPYEVPSSWVWMRLGDVGAIVGGGTPKSKDPKCWVDEGVPWLTPADMRRQESRYVSRGSRDISKVGLESSSARLMPAGTVLFSSRAPIGHVGIAGQDLATNQGFKSCVPYSSGMSEYIYLYLKKIGPEIDAAATGTTFKEVSGKEVALIPIPVPPLPEQRRIAEQVDELMALLDRLEAAQGSREATRQALRAAALSALRAADDPETAQSAWTRTRDNFSHLVAGPGDIAPLRDLALQLGVGGRLVPQHSDEEPAARLVERIGAERALLVKKKKIRQPKRLPEILDEDLPFELPSGWAAVRLGDVIQVSSGDNLPAKKMKTGSVPVYGGNGVAGFHDEANVEGQTIVIGRVGALCGNVHLTGESAWVTDNAFVVSFSRENLNRDFLVLLLRAAKLGRDNKATAQPVISGRRIYPRMVLIPPLDEQQRIVEKVTEVIALCDRLEVRLERARDTLASFSSSAVASFA